MAAPNICFRVRVETAPDAWEWMMPWLREGNARHCYDGWCRRSGKDVLDVELWKQDAQGERCVNHCSLRTDLREQVKPGAARGEVGAVQMDVFAWAETDEEDEVMA